jgi:hypothetical protein
MLAGPALGSRSDNAGEVVKSLDDLICNAGRFMPPPSKAGK